MADDALDQAIQTGIKNYFGFGCVALLNECQVKDLAFSILNAITAPGQSAGEVETTECYEVYVDSGRADELFVAFCRQLGSAIETSWKDSYDV